MIKQKFVSYDKKRSYHLTLQSKRLKVKKFFLSKELFPYDELTEESFMENEELFLEKLLILGRLGVLSALCGREDRSSRLGGADCGVAEDA